MLGNSHVDDETIWQRMKAATRSISAPPEEPCYYQQSGTRPTLLTNLSTGKSCKKPAVQEEDRKYFHVYIHRVYLRGNNSCLERRQDQDDLLWLPQSKHTYSTLHSSKLPNHNLH
ncbi:hypothetical protein JOB18_033723 [Solea senegalensis]|uniref:Uncharacterized protein n=1 Tax=Solea senegalensis TaxID=28829 RepID=A0AAV6RD12_SOLSE|nr:hypothetical protein JOB18_033723 [Solea senegalensis]